MVVRVLAQARECNLHDALFARLCVRDDLQCRARARIIQIAAKSDTATNHMWQGEALNLETDETNSQYECQHSDRIETRIDQQDNSIFIAKEHTATAFVG